MGHSITIRKALLLIAILALSILVIALGAAAKHSQFVNPAHSTYHLVQAVKMVKDAPIDLICPVPCFLTVLLCLLLAIVFFSRCTLKTTTNSLLTTSAPLRV